MKIKYGERFTPLEDQQIKENWIKLAEKYNLPLGDAEQYVIVSRKLSKEERLQIYEMKILEKLCWFMFYFV